jgi:hypothetical protein
METVESKYILEIDGRLLFIRSASEFEICKLANGKPVEVFWSRRLLAHMNTLIGLIHQGHIEDHFGLTNEFDFSRPAFEFVVARKYFVSLTDWVKDIVFRHPKISWESFISMDCPTRHSLSAEFPAIGLTTRKRVGRRPVFRDPETGELRNMKLENRQIIEYWDKFGDLEKVRFALEPKTKMPATKRNQIRSIRRILRDNRPFLRRPYNGKDFPM